MISMFMTPFSDMFLVTFTATSCFFFVEWAIVNKYYYFTGTEYYIKTVSFGFGWVFVMLLQSYNIRQTLIQFFLSQTEAEKTS